MITHSSIEKAETLLKKLDYVIHQQQITTSPSPNDLGDLQEQINVVAEVVEFLLTEYIDREKINLDHLSGMVKT